MNYMNSVTMFTMPPSLCPSILHVIRKTVTKMLFCVIIFLIVNDVRAMKQLSVLQGILLSLSSNDLPLYYPFSSP